MGQCYWHSCLYLCIPALIKKLLSVHAEYICHIFSAFSPNRWCNSFTLSVCSYIFFVCLYLSTKCACSSHKSSFWMIWGLFCLSWKPDEDLFWPSYFSWTRLPLMCSFGLVCISCLGFFGVFFFCFMPATHFSAIPPLQDSHSVGVCIDLASVWWTLNFSVCGPPPPIFKFFFYFSMIYTFWEMN